MSYNDPSLATNQATLRVEKPLTTEGLFSYDDVDTRMLYKEFQEGVQVYNEVEWGLMSQFCRETTKEDVRVWQRNMEFRTASEGYLEDWQKLRAMEISVPLEEFELGYAFTKRAIQMSTSDALRETQGEALRADQRLLANRFFFRALTPGAGAISIGWWDANMNAAGMRAPPNWKGNTFTVNHNHYDVSGAANIALSDFSAIKREIREHGYQGPLFLFMNLQEVEACENLAGWTTAMTANSIVEKVATKGFEVIKQFQGFTLIQDDWIPPGYLMAIESRVKPITIRNPVNAKARGLKLWEGPYSNYPLLEAYYSHWFDMAVVHRGAGAVRLITAGAWATPGFTF
ncbi:MAG: hypothetical protein KAX31_06660 [Thermoplasmata archaeon]|nr:hypothetical protein [Thermoplasmata archaeon]